MKERLPSKTRDWLHALVKTHYVQVQRYLLSLVYDEEVAKDLTQDVFVEAIGKQELLLSKVNDDQIAYLRGIGRNLARAHFRDRAREQELLYSNPAALLTRNDAFSHLDLALLRHCLKALPEQGRALIERHYFQAEPSKDIAASMGKSAAGLRMAMMRIRKALRNCIAEQMSQEGLL